MKIEDIIRTLIESGEDFSDHNYASAGDPPRLMHDSCAFCDAWREALSFVAEPRIGDFEPGEDVRVGDVSGVVEHVNIVYTLRITDLTGERRYGDFASQYVSACPDAVEFTYWRDKDGEVWERRESDSLMRLYSWAPGTTVGDKLRTPDDWTQVEDRFSHVEKRYGGPAGLVQVEKP